MGLSLELAKTSFAAGEVSPELRNRDDLAKKQTGCWFLENMVVLLEGGVTRRPGTRMIMPYKDPSRVAVGIPFRFSGSGSNAYLIVINAGVARFILFNGVVQAPAGGNYEVAVPYTDADLGGAGAPVAGVSNLRYAQSGNVLYLFCDGHAPQTLTRNADNSWTLAPYLNIPPPVQGNGSIGPVGAENITTITITVTDPLGAALTQTTAGPGQTVKLVASAPLFQGGMESGIWRIDEANLALVPEWTANENIVGTGNFRRFNGNVYVNLSAGNTGPNPPVHTVGSVTAINGGVTWQYTARDRGFVQIQTITDNQHATATVLEIIPVSAWTAGSTNWWPSAWDATVANGWPNRVIINGNALWALRQGRFWRTQPGSFNNFDIVDPTNPGEALAGQLVSPSGSLVWLEWMMGGVWLIAGTRDEEWVMTGANILAPISVANLQPYPSRQEGSAQHIPAQVEGGMCFLGRDRRRLHHCTLQYGFGLPTIVPEELTLTARHILRDHGGAFGVSHQRDPHRINWLWCADGMLVGNSLMLQQQVNGWHRHPQHAPTNSVIEWVATIPSNDEGQSWTYFGTKRTINGQTARFVELLQPFFQPKNPAAPDATGAWFVDCGLNYSGPPVQTITGLDHLLGQAVAVHADGSMYLNPNGSLPVVGAVTGGIGIVLSRMTSNCTVGLPISYRVRPLAFDLESPQKGSTQGARARANHFILTVVNSAGGMIAGNPDAGGVAEAIEPLGGPPISAGVPVPLITDVVRTQGISVPLADQAVVEITGSDTMPFTLTGIDPDIDVTESD